MDAFIQLLNKLKLQRPQTQHLGLFPVQCYSSFIFFIFLH